MPRLKNIGTLLSIGFSFLLLVGTAAQAQDLSGNSPDQFLKSFVNSVDAPIRYFLGVLCYLIALILVARGLVRLPKHASREQNNITLAGTIMCLVIGSVFITMPSKLNVFSQSLFGTDSYTYASLNLSNEDQNTRQFAEETLRAVLRVIQLFGLFWFISAWLNLLAASEGKGGYTVTGSTVRLVFATGCWEIYSVIAAIQYSFKINILEIN